MRERALALLYREISRMSFPTHAVYPWPKHWTAGQLEAFLQQDASEMLIWIFFDWGAVCIHLHHLISAAWANRDVFAYLLWQGSSSHWQASCWWEATVRRSSNLGLMKSEDSCCWFSLAWRGGIIEERHSLVLYLVRVQTTGKASVCRSKL